MQAPQIQKTATSPMSMAAPNVCHIVDLVLYAMTKKKGTAAWIEPVGGEGTTEVHRIMIEKGRRQVVSLKLAGGLGDAMLARLGLLAGLDLLATGVQNGRLSTRVGGIGLELLVTLRPTARGLSGEIHVLNSLGQDLDTEVTAPLNGEAYPEILAPGTAVGAYVVQKSLGRGGMGMVYLVEHAHLRKNFAMKVLHKKRLDSDPDTARRFVREARAAARVQHGGIVDVSDFGSFADGRHYLVMELLKGRSLYELIDEEGPVEPIRALRIMREAASALGAAHAAGVVHRDVSPSNVFIERVGDVETVKVVDFGAASLPDVDQTSVPDCPAGMVIGTPYYMAPEQARAQRTDSRSDMYSFGAVLYELVSGRPPFDGSSAVEIVLQHIQDPLPPLYSPQKAEIPESLWLVIERLMAKKPEDRYPTTDVVVAELDRVMALLQRKGWKRWLPV